MGIFAKLGKVPGHFMEQFGQPQLHRFSQERMGLSAGEMAGAPFTASAMGAGAGGLWGAAGTGFGAEGHEDMGTAAGRGAMQGAGLAGGFAAAMVSPIMAKRMIVAIARAFKQHAPDMPEEITFAEAQKLFSATPHDSTARQQVESILGPIDWNQMFDKR